MPQPAKQSEYQQSLDAIARRRAIAEAMLQGSLQNEGTQMSGTARHPIAVAKSPFEAIAKLGQTYMAGKSIKRSDDERAKIATAMSSEKQKALEALMRGGIGGGTYEQDPMADAEAGPTRGLPVGGARGKPSLQAQQAAIDAGIDPSVIAAANKSPERFSLSPGEVVKDETGALIAEGGPMSGKSGPADVQEYEYAKAQGYKGSFQEYQIEMKKAGASSVNVNTEKLPTPPQGMAYVKDPNSQFGYRLEKIPGARDPRTENQQKAGLLAKRMGELSGDVMNEAPSVFSQQAATYAQKGGVLGALANKTLSAKDQKHFNAARGWLAGILRQDTGATISDTELEQYYPTYFPVPGDSAAVIEQKRKLRNVTQAGLATIGGDQEQQQPAAPTGGVGARLKTYYGE